MMSETLSLTLNVICGASWTLAYIFIILQSFKDKAYGMPFVALAFNIAWEVLFATKLWDGNIVHLVMNATWGVLDIFILVSYLKYGIREWPRRWSVKLFYPFSFFVILTAFGFMYFFCKELHDTGGVYMAFIQTLVMSLLFVNMLNNRGTLAGQSVWIAVTKMIGTAAATAVVFMIRVKSLAFTGSLILSFDLIYLVMVLNHGRLVWPLRLKLRT